MKSSEQLLEDIQFPQTIFELNQLLQIGDTQVAHWKWLELSGGVLSQYVIGAENRFNALLNWFYKEQGFIAADKDYFSVHAIELAQVLSRRSGNATSFALLLWMLAKQLDLKVDIIVIPGQFVLRADLDGKQVYVNPINGEQWSVERLHKQIKGELGAHVTVTDEMLSCATDAKIIKQLVQHLKASSLLDKNYELALKCSNIQIDWFPDEYPLKRERAFIVQQLGCVTAAAADLQDFVDNSPKDAVRDAVKLQLKLLQDTTEVFH
ncbi:tetratricopeptide repeat protein [Paraferrimonas sp. SM1919]|uniref:transglutaminase family protein n=1 Tax=Paraferrimonas sp. SM1919 TaxID=2662263 RepID=UPI0013D2B4E0|nr:tetratricopeptide repeat protein [Paraferrimonas sp. SM1919]